MINLNRTSLLSPFSAFLYACTKYAKLSSSEVSFSNKLSFYNQPQQKKHCLEIARVYSENRKREIAGICAFHKNNANQCFTLYDCSLFHFFDNSGYEFN